MQATPKISVAIRKRPLTRKEINKQEVDIIEVTSPATLLLKEPKIKLDMSRYTEEHDFTFDGTFSENESNNEVYLKLVRPLVAEAFQGSKITCFAYGQTGSGKTFTMMGSTETGVPGLYLLATQDIFALLNSDQYSKMVVGISFYEIYCSKAYDLLNNRELCQIRVDAKENVNIVGLKEKLINNPESLMSLIHYGSSVRITGTTGMNEDSSRSHAILQITLREQSSMKQYGKLSFIDLAGSERGADVTDTNKQTRLDGAEINKSLLALKECIRAMDQEKRHIPFRGSKLTLVLKDSFVGQCKTLMIGNISPAQSSCEHTLNTLRYADRVKELKKHGNNSNKNKSPKNNLANILMLPRRQRNNSPNGYSNLDNNKRVYHNPNVEHYNINPRKSEGCNIVFKQNRMSEGYYQQNNISSQVFHKNKQWEVDQEYLQNSDMENIIKMENETLFEECIEEQSEDQLEEIPRDNILPTQFNKLKHNNFICDDQHKEIEANQYNAFQANNQNINQPVFRGFNSQNEKQNINNFNFQQNDAWKPQENNHTQGYNNNQPFSNNLNREVNYDQSINNSYLNNFNQQMMERLSDQQDQLIEEHSLKIDKIVEIIKQDMNLLEEQRNNRKIISSWS